MTLRTEFDDEPMAEMWEQVDSNTWRLRAALSIVIRRRENGCWSLVIESRFGWDFELNTPLKSASLLIELALPLYKAIDRVETKAEKRVLQYQRAQQRCRR